jgi:hypothetical protein
LDRTRAQAQVKAFGHIHASASAFGRCYAVLPSVLQSRNSPAECGSEATPMVALAARGSRTHHSCEPPQLSPKRKARKMFNAMRRDQRS